MVLRIRSPYENGQFSGGSDLSLTRPEVSTFVHSQLKEAQAGTVDRYSLNLSWQCDGNDACSPLNFHIITEPTLDLILINSIKS